MSQRKDLTIIYYTSNREEEAFEKRVRQKLLEISGNVPIISVSHKPIKLGNNICVGIHHPSNATLYRQLLIGCKAAKTPFVANAEADFLYPPEYLSFKPINKNKIYRYGNIRVLYKYHGRFLRKFQSEGAQIAGRKYLISILENALKDMSEWYEKESTKHRRFIPYHRIQPEVIKGRIACVTFKTGDSLRKATAVEKGSAVHELPYWGKAGDLRKEMFKNEV